MWEAYNGKVIFITGGSGFLGTALVYRLVTETQVDHIYLLCRGGVTDLREKWSRWLPDHTVRAMCDKSRVTILTGDLSEADLGLNTEAMAQLATRVNTVIHSASSINLKAGLADVAATVVDATERLAFLAGQWCNLNDFVYVSTAFCNTHLGNERVEEAIHPPGWKNTIDDERAAMRSMPSTTEIPGFYWPYAYAKNLTERLLDRMIQCNGSENPIRLLIDPTREATFEEVPVDVAVDRLLLHVAKGTAGVVHAIGGTPVRFQQRWEQMLRVRRLWKIKPTWIHPDHSSDPVHRIAQLMKVIGVSFEFSQERTIALCKDMAEGELSGLQLFRHDVNDVNGRYDLRAGPSQLWYCMDRFTRKDGWRRKWARALYGSWASATPDEPHALKPEAFTNVSKAARGNRL